jgi:glutamine synthetase
VDLVTKRGIFTQQEFLARQEIHLEAYNKLINIEARTMVDMVMHQILPAAIRYSAELAGSANQKRDAFGNRVKAFAEQSICSRLSEKCDSLYEKAEKLYADLKAVPACDNQTAADYYNDVIVPGMEAVRKDADFLEKLTPKCDWPYPIYSDLLFY